MMKHEFEQAMDISVSAEAFERIEAVYLNSEFFASKEQLYSFYKQYDMNGIERLYKDVLIRLRLEREMFKLQQEHKEHLDYIVSLKDTIGKLRGFKNDVVESLVKYGEVI